MAGRRTLEGTPADTVDLFPKITRFSRVASRFGASWMRAGAVAGLVALLGSCASAPPIAAVPAIGDTAAVEPFPHSVVWTAAPGTLVTTEVDSGQEIRFASTRLDVIGTDSIGLRVRCSVCDPPVAGYVNAESIRVATLPPEIAAFGDLVDFALAVRSAAASRDFRLLRPIMNPEFTYDFIGIQTPQLAFEVWTSEGFTSLDELPSLLDRGLSSADGRIWVTPPEFVHEPTYQGLRAGFRRREDGRWEWLYLIRGILTR